jgi:hypothetical protein
VGGLNFGTATQSNRCVGCHAGHSLLDVPLDPSWTNLAPSAEVTASSVLILTAASKTERFVLRPEALVDRKTDALVSEWSAGSEDVSRVDFRWSVPLRARAVVLHSPRTGAGQFGARDQVLWRFTITTEEEGQAREEQVHRVQIPTPITRVDLDPRLQFDHLTITIRALDVTGVFEGQKGPALAEVEVIAQVDPEPPLRATSLLRGDSNCDGQVGLSDAVAILGSLFLGKGGLCCAAGADVNLDGAVGLTDAVYLLQFSFLSGPAPEAPFPSCGQSFGETLGCEGQCPPEVP